MEINSNKKNFRECCRFCLKKVTQRTSLFISDEIKTSFEELTKIELRISEEYSSICCSSCLTNLKSSVIIKNEFIKTQDFLYKHEQDFQVKEEEDRSDIEDIKKEQEPEYDEKEIECLQEIFEFKHEIFAKTEDSNPEEENPDESEPSGESDSEKTENKKRKRSVKSAKISQKCPHCDAVVKNLKTHIEATHLKIKRFQCPYCDKKFYQKLKMERHSAVHTRQKHSCSICSREYKSKLKLKWHIENIHKNAVIKKAKEPEDYEKNIEIIRKAEEDEKSEKIKKYINNRQEMLQNRREKTTCPVCGLTLSQGSLKKHIEAVHENQRRFGCDVCGKRFYRKIHLVEHIKAHFNVRDVICDICQMGFPSNNVLYTHKKTVHENKYRYNKQCPICGKIFQNAFNYTSHYRAKHTGERPFACDKCQKTFVSASDLKVHKKGVHEEKPIKCNVCGKFVANSYVMKTHKKYHEGKNFKCNQIDNGRPCEKAYITNHLLQKHIQTSHMNIKRLSCPIVTCDMKYSCRSDLNTHVKTIHERRKIKCVLCNALLSSKEYYCRHVRSHHDGMNPVEKETLLTKIKQTSLEELYNHVMDGSGSKNHKAKLIFQ